MQRSSDIWNLIGGRAADFVRRNPFECAALLLLSVYFAFDLTPSSYAFVLRALDVTDTGLIFGEPSLLRIDEFGAWTPYFQSVVRNGFQRYNETSPYHEDFRNFVALPLSDWALVFKPQLWGFFVLPADRAFSLYHTLLIGSCLIGWSLVFRLWGFPTLWAAAASLLIFFSGHTQMAWTSWGPLMALFPLLILAISSKLRPLFKFLLLAWLITIWLLSHLYPPVIISLGVAGIFLVAAFTPRTALDWRNIAVAAAALLVSVLLVRLYFAGVFEIMAATVYPGQRSLPGGGLSWAQGLAHYFPFLTTRMDLSTVGANAYEVATASSYLPLAALIFLDWRNFAKVFAASAEFRWTLCVLLAGLVLFGLWLLAPIPPSVGALILFDMIAPERMMGASALLLMAMSMLLLQRAGAIWSVLRFALMAVLVITMWLLWKGGPSLSLPEAFGNNGYWDLTILLALFLAGLLLWRRKKEGVATAILLACVAVNIVGFGWVNPLQSARPIFADVSSPIIKAYRDMQQRDERNWLVAPSMPGVTAALNGLGFRSISHVLMAPRLDFFRPYFPDLTDSQFNELFNRFSWIELHDVEAPFLTSAIEVVLPIDVFVGPRAKAERVLDGSWQSEPLSDSQTGGHVDKLEILDGRVAQIVGWAMLDPADPGNKLIVVSSDPSKVVAKAVFRLDVLKSTGDPKLFQSGFVMTVTGTGSHPIGDQLEVYSVSPRYGVRKLTMPQPN